MENEQKEMWERLTAVEQSTKSAHHRLDSLDKLTESVHIIATETVSYTHLTLPTKA